MLEFMGGGLQFRTEAPVSLLVQFLESIHIPCYMAPSIFKLATENLCYVKFPLNFECPPEKAWLLFKVTPD